jgi:AcrR family transcriptional regulator
MPRVSDAHKAARREQIVAAAMRCFHDNGFHPTTMDDIIRASGLSAGAVYTYFRSKDDLIVAAGSSKLGALWATMDNLVAADPVPTPAQAIRTIVDRVVEVTIVGDLDLARIIIFGWGETSRNAELRDTVHRAYRHFVDGAAILIERWQANGALRPGVDPADAAPALVSFMLGFVVQRGVVGPIDPDAYARGAAALLGGPAPSAEVRDDLPGRRD